MKRMVCEICGGNDIEKKDGVFVCNGCGTQYSVEEAKKLLVEVGENDKDADSVKIEKANKERDKSKIENLRSLARRARKEQDDDDSSKDYYERIMKEDPDDWEAYYYSNLFKLIQKFNSVNMDGLADVDYYNSVQDDFGRYVNSFKNNLDFTLMLIKDHVSSDEQKEALREVLQGLYRITTSCLMPTALVNYMLFSDMGEHNYEPIGGSVVFSPHIIKVYSKCVKLLKSFAEQASGLFKEEEMMIRAYVSLFNFSSMEDNPMFPYFTADAKSVLRKAKDSAKEGLKPVIDQKTKEYWESKAEYKQTLSEKKSSLIESIKELELDLKNSGEDELKTKTSYISGLEANVASLNKEYNGLGFFKRKEKEVLQLRISDANKELAAAKKEEADLKAVIDPITEKINSAKREINRIDKELSGAENKVFQEIKKQYTD